MIIIKEMGRYVGLYMIFSLLCSILKFFIVKINIRLYFIFTLQFPNLDAIILSQIL